jgi:hypothetical protein
MRPLTADEKAASEAARKRVNRVFGARRTEIGEQLRKLPITAKLKREELLKESLALRDVKGKPALLLIDGVEIMLDYELYRRLTRTLKNRYWRQEIKVVAGAATLRIEHCDRLTGGTIELHAMPQYQRDLLTDLPIISTD